MEEAVKLVQIENESAPGDYYISFKGASGDDLPDDN